MNKEKDFSDKLELAGMGFANGKAPGYPFTDEQKWDMVEEAQEAFGKFLDALKVDWRNDPNSSDTPRRVAKAYVFQLWEGRYGTAPDITAFPSDGYDGIVQESNIPVTSMCSHHHLTIMGDVSVAYIPGKDGKVIGLSKLNRIVEYFGRRGAIQEQLTVAIHNAVDKICEGNQGVAVMVNATHNCVACRGVKHRGAAMQTAKLSGSFLHEDAARSEFYKNIELSLK